MFSRAVIVEEAKSWIGTRYHHQGRLKKSSSDLGGCDCLGLIIGVARSLCLPSKVLINGNYIPLCEFDPRFYPKRPNGRLLYSQLSVMLNKTTHPKSGDVILFDIQDNLQHLAIYSDDNKIIHSLIEVRKVVEHNLDNFWRGRIHSVFSFNQVL